jgi:hypothetical protein
LLPTPNAALDEADDADGSDVDPPLRDTQELSCRVANLIGFFGAISKGENPTLPCSWCDEEATHWCDSRMTAQCATNQPSSRSNMIGNFFSSLVYRSGKSVEMLLDRVYEG